MWHNITQSIAEHNHRARCTISLQFFFARAKPTIVSPADENFHPQLNASGRRVGVKSLIFLLRLSGTGENKSLAYKTL